MDQEITDETIITIIKRYQYLKELVGDYKSKSELIEGVKAPRSTVDRAVRDLEAVDAVERTARGYGTTAFGELLHREIIKTRQRTGGLLECNDVIQSATDVSKLSTELFRDVNIVKPTKSEPDAHLRHLHDCVKTADRVRVVSPFILTQSVRFYHDELTTSDLSAEFLLSSPCVKDLLSSYAREFDETLAQDSVAVYETTSGVPFGLMLLQRSCNSRVAVLLQSTNGVSALLLSSNRIALDWGNRVYKRYKRRARKLG